MIRIPNCDWFRCNSVCQWSQAEQFSPDQQDIDARRKSPSGSYCPSSVPTVSMFDVSWHETSQNISQGILVQQIIVFRIHFSEGREMSNLHKRDFRTRSLDRNVKTWQTLLWYLGQGVKMSDVSTLWLPWDVQGPVQGPWCLILIRYWPEGTSAVSSLTICSDTEFGPI